MLIRAQGCVSNCWDNSKYVSTCTKGNETLCLCKDAHFQNVGNLRILGISICSYDAKSSRSSSNVSTPNARPLNSALLYTTLLRLALSPTKTFLASCLLSFVTKVYANAEVQPLGLLLAMFLHQRSTRLRVAQSVLQHYTSHPALEQPVPLAIFQLPRMAYPHLRWLLSSHLSAMEAQTVRLRWVRPRHLEAYSIEGDQCQTQTD